MTEEFKAWWKDQPYFELSEKMLAWIAWQASREAVEVTLPQRWSVDGFGSGWVAHPEGANLDYTETVKTIEAVGLRVKE